MFAVFTSKEKERERLVRASQSLYTSVQRLVSTTIRACEIFNDHLNESLPGVEVTDNLCIRAIVDRLHFAMQAIHSTAESTDKHVQKNLERSLYDKITIIRSSVQEKRVIIQNFQEATMGIFGSVCGPIICVLMKQGDLLDTMESSMVQIETSPVLALRLGDLLLGSDQIAKQITKETSTRRLEVTSAQLKKNDSLGHMSSGSHINSPRAISGIDSINEMDASSGIQANGSSVLIPAPLSLPRRPIRATSDGTSNKKMDIHSGIQDNFSEYLSPSCKLDTVTEGNSSEETVDGAPGHIENAKHMLSVGFSSLSRVFLGETSTQELEEAATVLEAAESALGNLSLSFQFLLNEVESYIKLLAEPQK